MFFGLLRYRDDVNKQLDTIQGDLDSLKELFQADNDYSLDANALFGVSGLTCIWVHLCVFLSVDVFSMTKKNLDCTCAILSLQGFQPSFIVNLLFEQCSPAYDTFRSSYSNCTSLTFFCFYLSRHSSICILMY